MDCIAGGCAVTGAPGESGGVGSGGGGGGSGPFQAALPTPQPAPTAGGPVAQPAGEPVPVPQPSPGPAPPAPWPGQAANLPQTGDRPYVPPKSSRGQPKKVPAGRRGGARGYEDADGNIWIWNPPGSPTAHGGPHWDVEHKDGSHTNVNPDGSVRGPDNFPNKPRGSGGRRPGEQQRRRGRRRGRGRRRDRRDHLVGGQGAVTALRPRRPGLRGGAVKSPAMDPASIIAALEARSDDRRPLMAELRHDAAPEKLAAALQMAGGPTRASCSRTCSASRRRPSVSRR